MKSLGFKSCKADPDLWLKPEIIPEDGVKYCSYLLCYVGDILCIHHNADSILEQWEMKNSEWHLNCIRWEAITHRTAVCMMPYCNDIKIDDFRQKTRIVAGGHMTKTPATITYASIIMRETVRIVLMIIALNDLKVKSGNILNAYIQAPVTEKVWTTLSPEFSKDIKKTAVTIRALYGIK